MKTIDLKRTAYVGRNKIAKQIHNMGWDLQAGAYREAAMSLVTMHCGEGSGYSYQGHTLLCAEDGGDRVQCYPLDEVYLEVGKRRWEQGQRIWQECQATGNWPDDSEDPISPPMYIVRKEIETFEQFEEEP